MFGVLEVLAELGDLVEEFLLRATCSSTSRTRRSTKSCGATRRPAR
ncbi:hypothetical protein [Streptomyces sp. R44]|uniref:Uncharacterized protein n=1 Tax=Streptomyces sp. R44 TaxID=3238633 RepID=A0AB39TEF3_9ACTN